MAKRRSDLNPGDSPDVVRSDVDPAATYQPVEPGDVRRDPLAANLADDSDLRTRKPNVEKSSAEIERDIEHTRAEMSETIGAIQERLSPEHLKQEVKDTVHETIDSVKDRFSPENIKHAIKDSARDAGRGMLDTIKENPLPSLIAGLSVGWLIMKSREDTPSERYYDSYGRPRYYGRGTYRGARDYEEPGYYRERRPYGNAGYYETGYGYDYEAQSGGRSVKDRVSDTAGDIGHRVSDTADEIKHRVGDTADEIRDRARSVASQAQHRVEDFGHEVQHQARRATRTLEDVLYESPLAAGALAIGVGALLGALLPSTRTEDEWMGETRDRVVHKAEDVAHETMDKVEQVAERTAEEAARAVKEVKDTAKQEAQRVKETAKESAREVKDTAKAGAQNQTRT